MEDFLLNLQKAIEIAGSQSNLARALGVTRATINAWLHKEWPRISHIHLVRAYVKLKGNLE
jgi:plasmid maintenance system antidote protein VapI